MLTTRTYPSRRLRRPYRAPELLFGTTDYDACAIDLWSMGAVLAEFFTPLRLRKSYEDEDDGEGRDG